MNYMRTAILLAGLTGLFMAVRHYVGGIASNCGEHLRSWSFVGDRPAICQCQWSMLGLGIAGNLID
jgi:hypothetical protein